MATTQTSRAAMPPENRYQSLLGYYAIALSIVMLVFGLRQWAIIVGVLPGPTDGFEAMSTAWKIATMHMAVVDLVAAVGLWMRVAWGRVVWVYAAVSEIMLHTAFIGTFGPDLPKVVFHFFTLAVFVLLTLLARRASR